MQSGNPRLWTQDLRFHLRFHLVKTCPFETAAVVEGLGCLIFVHSHPSVPLGGKVSVGPVWKENSMIVAWP